MIKILMRYKKSTKNTYVFEEIDDSGDIPIDMLVKIPTLYIRKHCFDGKEPMQISVEVTKA
ncbi:hypothetical protein LCGC14_1017020 [marine sediment metagenome]|uniref:Uncharacterized protein n=1 Tax=marine sediment metagenome TaxID=412755 RepID=A0A0F9QGT8_9ZZZZ